MTLIRAATAWKTNAHLILDCVQLGYLRKEWRTYDPTYGRGTWWKLWEPDDLVVSDLRTGGIDFRALPFDDTFDAIAFDPPYMAPGGRKTSTLGEMNDRFGMHTTPKTPKANQDMINDGIVELTRVLNRKGIMLIKCMDYIWGGKYFAGTHKTTNAAEYCGLELIDRLEHIRPPGPQSQTTQVHARRNLSTLLVFKKK